MNNNYIIIHNKSLKINLLSKKGSWSFKLSGKSWVVADCLERLYAYLILGENNINETSGTLRANYKHITPIEIDEFVAHFRATHPVEKVGFTWDMVPTYATDKVPLTIPNSFSYQVVLSEKQENELLEIIKTHPDSAKSRIENWFSWYIYRYGLVPRLKRDIEAQAPELCLQFCRQHGVNIEGLKGGGKAPIVKRWQTEIKDTLLAWLVILAYVTVAVLLMLWGSKMTNHFFLSTIIMTVGWAMIGVPLYYMFNSSKK